MPTTWYPARPTLPCRRDPAATDVTDGYKPRGATPVAEVHRVLAVAEMCNTACVFVDLCLERATANPPTHRCVMGGQVWELDSGEAMGATTAYDPDTWALMEGVDPTAAPEGSPTCPVCQVTFADDQGAGRIYCSPRCKEQAREQRAGQTCAVCGEDRGATRKLRREHDAGCASRALCDTCGRLRGETVRDRRRHAMSHAREQAAQVRDARGPHYAQGEAMAA